MVRPVFAALAATALAVCHVQVRAGASCECAEWAAWSECSADCEHGTQTRQRQCTYVESYAIERDQGEAREDPIDHSVKGAKPHSIEGGSYAGDTSEARPRPVLAQTHPDTPSESYNRGVGTGGQGVPFNHAVMGDKPHSIATHGDEPVGQYRTYPEGTVLDSPHSMENIKGVQGGIRPAGDEYPEDYAEENTEENAEEYAEEYEAPAGPVRDHSIRGDRPHSIPVIGEEDNSQSAAPNRVDHSVRADRPHSVAIVDDLGLDATEGFTDTSDFGISSARSEVDHSIRGDRPHSISTDSGDIDSSYVERRSGREEAHRAGRRSVYSSASYVRHHSGSSTQSTGSGQATDRGSQMQCMARQVQRRPCNTHACGSRDPVTCHCTAWSAYSQCTQPCGPRSTHVRQRVCMQGSNGGLSCEALGLEMEQVEPCSGSECAAGRLAPAALTEPAKLEVEGGALRTLWFAIPAGIVALMLVVASTVTVAVVVRKSRERRGGTYSVRVPILDVERESSQDLVRGCVSSESMDTAHI